MIAVEQGARNETELLDKVSRAYIMSAEEVARCNARLNRGKQLQRDLIENIEE